VLRTSVSEDALGAEDTVRAYTTLTKNTIQPHGDLPTFEQLTAPTELQKKALDLLGVPIPL
jgi:hypothetical protein